MAAPHPSVLPPRWRALTAHQDKGSGWSQHCRAAPGAQPLPHMSRSPGAHPFMTRQGRGEATATAGVFVPRPSATAAARVAPLAGPTGSPLPSQARSSWRRRQAPVPGRPAKDPAKAGRWGDRSPLGERASSPGRPLRLPAAGAGRRRQLGSGPAVSSAATLQPARRYGRARTFTHSPDPRYRREGRLRDPQEPRARLPRCALHSHRPRATGSRAPQLERRHLPFQTAEMRGPLFRWQHEAAASNRLQQPAEPGPSQRAGNAGSLEAAEEQCI